MKGKYIYGIIKGNGKIQLRAKGLFNKRPYTLNYNSISAIITDAPIKTYESDEKGLLSHNRVLDEAIKLQTVLPIRFGTIASSEDEVKNLLRSAYSVLLNKLEKIRDKAEFDLTIVINNEQIILQEILEKNKNIRNLRDELISKGQNADIKDKLLIGKMIADEIFKNKKAFLEDIINTLKPYYSIFKKLIGKNVLANLAFLVSKNKLKDFESCIYKLGDRYGDRLKFKYAGPLPPYSFVEMKIILINFNTVNEARQKLGLGEQVTTDDIKNAYRKLAQDFHPDLNPGNIVKEEEFKKITDAYKLLSEYCRHYPKKQYLFKPQEIDEFSILAESET